jgi:hypothetical protein
MVIAQKVRAISMFENFAGKHPMWRVSLLPLGSKTGHNLAALQNIHVMTSAAPVRRV